MGLNHWYSRAAAARHSSWSLYPAKPNAARQVCSQRPRAAPSRKGSAKSSKSGGKVVRMLGACRGEESSLGLPSGLPPALLLSAAAAATSREACMFCL